MQVKQAGKRHVVRGRRFTMEEKVLSLALYKPSPKAYRIMSNFCILPSRRTLQNMLYKVKLGPGFNQRIFNYLKEIVAKMPQIQRHCSLVFDEMPHHVLTTKRENLLQALWMMVTKKKISFVTMFWCS